LKSSMFNYNDGVQATEAEENEAESSCKSK
jgi:hypothetical protein